MMDTIDDNLGVMYSELTDDIVKLALYSLPKLGQTIEIKSIWNKKSYTKIVTDYLNELIKKKPDRLTNPYGNKLKTLDINKTARQLVGYVEQNLSRYSLIEAFIAQPTPEQCEYIRTNYFNITASINGQDYYKITDIEGLQRYINKCTKTLEYRAFYSGNLLAGDKNLFGETILDNESENQIGASFPEIDKLYIVEITLTKLADNKLNKRRTSTPVNIRNDYSGDYMPKPPIDSTIKDIENPSPEKYKTLSKVYRTNEAIKEENGLFATVTDPTLFDLLPIEYQDPVKLLSLYNRSNRRGLVTCFRYAEANPNPPSEIRLDELAKYNLAYAEQIEKRGYLDSHYRVQLFNELLMVKGTNTFYTYFDKKTKKEMIGSIRFFDFDLSTDGKIIKNFRYTDEYIAAVNNREQAMLHLAIPKEIDLLEQTAQDIAYKIIQKQVDKRQMVKTINNEPLIMKLSDLYKGILAKASTKQQRAKRKIKTIDALDKIAETGTVIATYNIIRKNKTDYIELYPAEFMQKAYKDANLSHALKQAHDAEQNERRRELERLIKHYREDFKKKTNPDEHLQALSDDLNITLNDLHLYRIKADKRKKISPKEIDNELIANIRELLAYYESED